MNPQNLILPNRNSTQPQILTHTQIQVKQIPEYMSAFTMYKQSIDQNCKQSEKDKDIGIFNDKQCQQNNFQLKGTGFLQNSNYINNDQQIQKINNTQEKNDSSQDSSTISSQQKQENQENIFNDSEQEKIDINEKQNQDQNEKQNLHFINQGRWSKKEHQLFMQGWQLYERNWIMLSNFIQTRDPTQVRSHAQKHFNKVFQEETHKILQENGGQNVIFQVKKSKKRLRQIKCKQLGIPYEEGKYQKKDKSQSNLPVIKVLTKIEKKQLKKMLKQQNQLEKQQQQQNDSYQQIFKEIKVENNKSLNNNQKLFKNDQNKYINNQAQDKIIQLNPICFVPIFQPISLQLQQIMKKQVPVKLVQSGSSNDS